MGEHLLQPKSELRRHFRAQQRQVPAARLAEASRAVCAEVSRLTTFQRAAHVVAYVARPDEIDPAPLVESGRRDGKVVYFPRVAGAGLEFRSAALQDLRPGAYGLLEPLSGPVLPGAASGVLFLVPGLAFDLGGVRLGRGGGHYDRALAEHQGARRVGLALDGQLTSELPRDPWDQLMDAVLTERRLLWPAARHGAGLKENLQ